MTTGLQDLRTEVRKSRSLVVQWSCSLVVPLFFRPLYLLYRWLSALRYRAQRRFTRVGLTALGALMVSALVGVDTENSVAYQAFTLLLALLLVAVSFGWIFRARFAVRRLLPSFGTVGRPLNYTLVVENLTSKSQNHLTLLEDLADPRPSYPEWLANQLAAEKQVGSFRLRPRRGINPFKAATVKEAEVPPLGPRAWERGAWERGSVERGSVKRGDPLPSLSHRMGEGRERVSDAPTLHAPRSQAEVRAELTPLRRGVLRFNGLRLARTDPLGLCRAFAKVPLPQAALILPKRYSMPPIALPGTQKYQAGGVTLASNVGQSDEFVALRDYRRGDALRHIHWRSWAKAGKPVVKEFEDEFFVRHALVLDTFTEDPHSEAFEEAVSVAASFACAIRTQESLLDLMFVGPQSYCFTAGRGLAHTDQMLEILASVRPCRDQPFGALGHLVLNHVEAVSGCIGVLLAWNEERRRFVEKLKALGVPVLVLVVVEPGQDVALDPGPMREEPERFQVLEAGRIEQGLAELI